MKGTRMYSALAAAMMLAVCGLWDGKAALAAETHEVLVGNDFFNPPHIEVAPGDIIEWVWVAGFHTATSGTNCGLSGLFHGPVDMFNPTFTWTVPADFKPGVIDYLCLPHCSHMTGTITVKEAGVLGDLNGDGVVDVSDLLILLGAWGDCPDPDDCPADLNNDGVVDVSDLLILLGNWG